MSLSLRSPARDRAPAHAHDDVVDAADADAGAGGHDVVVVVPLFQGSIHSLVHLRGASAAGVHLTVNPRSPRRPLPVCWQLGEQEHPRARPSSRADLERL